MNVSTVSHFLFMYPHIIENEFNEEMCVRFFINSRFLLDEQTYTNIKNEHNLWW